MARQTSRSVSKKVARKAKGRVEDLEKVDKRVVTLHLNRANFEKLQNRYGRNCSKVIDELIESLLEEVE